MKTQKISIRTDLLTHTEHGEEHIESQTEGHCEVGEHGVRLTFDEPEGNVHTTWVIADGLAECSRSGDIISRFVFVPQRMLEAPYSVHGQTFPLQLYTHALAFSLTPGGGQCEIRYTLLQGGQAIADNRLELRFIFL
ncbi:MAG: DUF1934 domain-containing protein [Alloprevotella sp.]